MKEQINAWRLAEIAENARAIIEDGQDNDPDYDYNNKSKESASQSSKQQLQKLRKKPIITGKKNLEKAKMKGFRKEIEKFFI